MNQLFVKIYSTVNKNIKDSRIINASFNKISSSILCAVTLQHQDDDDFTLIWRFEQPSFLFQKFKNSRSNDNELKRQDIELFSFFLESSFRNLSFDRRTLISSRREERNHSSTHDSLHNPSAFDNHNCFGNVLLHFVFSWFHFIFCYGTDYVGWGRTF